MSITATTLSGAMTASATVLTVASATGITAPNFQTASGITYLLIDQEKMLVVAVSGTFVSVVRAQDGTAAMAHVNGAYVQSGLPSDFRKYQEVLQDELMNLGTVAAFKRPAINLSGTADAIDPSIPANYVVLGTSAVDAMTIATPTAAMEGNIIEVMSGSNYAHTLTAASTCINAGVAAKTIITWPAYQGAGVVLRVRNLGFDLVGSGYATNGGPVILS